MGYLTEKCYLRKSNYMASLCNLRNNEKNLGNDIKDAG